ncbi:hypothetical protein [Prescottella agglutinans]|uniref:Transposase InsO family protein n=1 Tax=Prescottella agglutinans TaxID=1644129 RepID=A0ABT6MLC8_9NOCA|nr:hypothetical protein [Prescottella agglutinans]MDH6284154.1 transposase InsO family protein [Prescottella agglutinans]
MIDHNDRGSQYASDAFAQRLIEAVIDASIQATGNSYDNALAETLIATSVNTPGSQGVHPFMPRRLSLLRPAAR